MFKKLGISGISALLMLLSYSANASSVWGEDYFPNTELTTHEGKKVQFFDDLIEGKVVAINFIYTSCPDVCPLETAQLVRVQQIMGDRVGTDVHFYSITIDPETDTPEVLADYRDRFGAEWTFLTGDKQEIINLRKSLGLYIDGIDDGPNKNNHNVSMIVGNQKTGRWMKRSPFENPHVLADQLGNWLNGWTSKQNDKSYADAPDLRPMATGESLFRTRCASCHSVDGVEEEGDIGPDLLGVTERRERKWLIKWLRAPDKMIENKDPLALALLKKYNGVPMPNLRLNQQEVTDLLVYMEQLEDPNAAPKVSKMVERRRKKAEKKAREAAAKTHQAGEDVVAVMNAWVKEAHPRATVNAGYMTLINIAENDVSIVRASSPDFESVEFHEMTMEDGMMQMFELASVEIAAGGQFKFVPGGKHLMLRKPKRRLEAGDQTDITLEFENGQTQALTLKVKKPAMP